MGMAKVRRALGRLGKALSAPWVSVLAGVLLLIPPGVICVLGGREMWRGSRWGIHPWTGCRQFESAGGAGFLLGLTGVALILGGIQRYRQRRREE